MGLGKVVGGVAKLGIAALAVEAVSSAIAWLARRNREHQRKE